MLRTKDRGTAQGMKSNYYTAKQTFNYLSSIIISINCAIALTVT